MADKPLNEVTKVTNLNNVKTFLAVMNDNTIQQMSKEDLASVVGGLIGTATTEKNGLMSKDIYRRIESYDITTQSGKFTLLFNLKLFAQGCAYIKFGDTTNNNASTFIVDINNRSNGSSVSVILSKTTINGNLTANLYARRNSDSSIDVFVKQVVTTYPVLKLSWVFAPEEWEWTYVGKVSDVSESELTKIV
jgi:hypothetical protein